MVEDVDALRARAEASFRKPDGIRPADATALELRERTERLREARLAKEALDRKGREIRAARRRGS